MFIKPVMIMALRLATVLSVLAAQQAVAAPNVFWIFGFDYSYARGAGGRADASGADANQRGREFSSISAPNDFQMLDDHAMNEQTHSKASFYRFVEDRRYGLSILNGQPL